jgi:hypothetical protein
MRIQIKSDFMILIALFHSRAQVRFQDIVAANGTKGFALVNPEKLKKKNYKDSGTLNIKLTVDAAYSFLDYIVGGLEISLIAGIDFTGSNGNPSLPSSLHYINPQAKNEYQMALEMGE